MAYDDWVDTQPKRYGSKPYPQIEGSGDIYGWHGDGWYYMDENGMLCGGRHPTKAKALEKRAEIKQRRQQWAQDKADGKDPRKELRKRLRNK